MNSDNTDGLSINCMETMSCIESVAIFFSGQNN